VLQLFTLFEKLDSDTTALNWQRFIDEGVVEPNSKMFEWDMRDTNSLSVEQRSILNTADTDSLELLRLLKRKVIPFHIKRERAGWYEREGRFVTEQIVVDNYEPILDQIQDAQYDFPGLSDFIIDLRLIYVSWRDCMFYSGTEHVPFASPMNTRNSANDVDVSKLLNDVSYIARTKLTDEVLILPQPTTIAEAIRIRNNKNMVRFREVLSEWCRIVQTDDSRAESKIRKDLKLANGALKRVEKWREYQQSPLNFWLNSVGGQIPVMSNVLAAIYTLGTLTYNGLERKNGWVMLASPSNRQTRKSGN
jgi:hypothetical protein